MFKGIFLFLLFSFHSSFAQVSTTRQYSDVLKILESLAAQYPQNVSVFTLGYSDHGVAIKGIKVGQGEIHNLVVGTHHGNEYGSTEVALGFAETIARAPIAGQTVFVIPVLNIEGYNGRTRHEHINGLKVDMNRDYPGPCGTSGPFFSRSTKALADFLEEQNIVVSATIHAAWPAVVYPWGLSTPDTDTEYTPEFIAMALDAVTFSGYEIGNSTTALFPADGTYEDYAFWTHGIWTLLFEVGETSRPDLNQLNEIVNTNVPGLRKMLENAPKIRATHHQFTGRCDEHQKLLDLRTE